MARPRGRTPEQEKWIADLVRRHGPSEAARLATEAGVKITRGRALEKFREHYPGESSAPAAQLTPADVPPPPPGKPQAQAPPPPPPREPDAELLRASRDPAQLLQISLDRVLSLLGQGTLRDNLAVVDQAKSLVKELRLMKAEADARNARRVGVLILPPERETTEAA